MMNKCVLKRLVVTLFAINCSLFTSFAQTIQNGSRWWDGSVLYTASVAGDKVTMNGIGEHEGGFRFELTKVAGKQGEYILAGTVDQASSLRAKVGWRVQYVRQEGMYFLAIRNPQGDAVWKMTLTPDNLENSLGQERSAEQKPVSDMLQSWLMNTTYLGRFSKEELRLMRNEILARHGWKFQSKDLQDYFSRQVWYRPVADNNNIKLSVIEQLNIQLIKSEEAVPDEERAYADYSSGSTFNQDLRELVDGPEEADGEQVYHVATEAQFIASLRPNRTIIINEDVHLNLSRILEKESEFRKPGRLWADYDALGISKEPLVISEYATDGHQLTLKNFKNLTIRGSRNSSIEVDPRYAFCLRFVNCEDCTVENLTIGHTEGGFCDGGVIGVDGGKQILVNKCDLYGCGTYGLVLRETTDFGMIKSNIHDCTYGIMDLRDCVAVKFTTCDFFNNREYTLIQGWGVQGLSFNDCRFFANWGDAPLFQLDNEFYLSGCKVYHPTENLGTIDQADQSGKKNFFSPNPLDNDIMSRNLGPE
jgi:hypothetical protein